MSKHKDTSKTGKKTASKKRAEKDQSKKNIRSSGTSAKKRPRSSATRKKRSWGTIIAALGILCLLLLGFNLFLVLKLVPNLKASLKQDDMELQMPAEAELPEVKEVQNESRAEKTSPIPAPQCGAQVPKSELSHTDSAASKKAPAVQAPQYSAATASRTASAAQKDGIHKEKNASSPASQKNTVPEKPAVPEKKNTVPERTAASDKKHTARPVQHGARPEKPRQPAPSAGNLTFVFDDAGHNLEQLEHFLRLPFPCTIAVLPGLRYSSEAARRIRKAGKQVILHQPMQSVDLRIDPGPGAVTPGLSAEQIKYIVRKNLEEIWPAAGMNNHEGSLITADEEAMRAVLDVVAEKRIFFLDSRTTARSVVAKVAKERNMVVWERAIFIDNDKSRAAMEVQIKKGLRVAKQKGSAIMIGHVFTVELAQLLTEMYPALIEEGFSLSAVAEAAQKGYIE